MQQIRVITGPDRWMLQDEEGETFWIDIWAVEALAKVIRQVDQLGDEYVAIIVPRSHPSSDYMLKDIDHKKDK